MEQDAKAPYAGPTIVTLGTVAELTAAKGAKCVGSGDFLIEGLEEQNETSPICPKP
jgi:hypothetical protein